MFVELETQPLLWQQPGSGCKHEKGSTDQQGEICVLSPSLQEEALNM